MDEITVYVILGIVAVLVSAALIWLRQKGYIEIVKKFYDKYKVVIDVYGQIIEKKDPKLYKELCECGDTLKDAIADDEITREELLSIYKEAKDVYDRCHYLIKLKK